MMSEPASESLKARFLFILAGGLALAGAAGYVNVVFISAGAPAVTHVTGSVSTITSDIGHHALDHAVHILAIVCAFALGAAVSGWLIGAQTLRLDRPYGIALIIEGALLVAAGLVMPRSLLGSACLAAAAAGLQNAFASAYRGLVIRTTHLTGILTDLGFLLGARLRRHHVAPWRFGLLGGLLAAFALGGLAGAVAWDMVGPNALHAAGLPMLLGGSAFFRWRTRRTARASEISPARSGDA